MSGGVLNGISNHFSFRSFYSYYLLFKLGQGLWTCALYFVPAFCMFFWGPAFISKLTGTWVTDACIYAVITLLIMWGIYMVEQLAIPVIVLIYSSIYYAAISFFVTNIIVFLIFPVVIIGAGITTASNLLPANCTRHTENWFLIILFRILAVPIYGYTVLLLQACFMNALRTSEPWHEFYKEPLDFSRLSPDMPYLWLVPLITLVINGIGLVLDIKKISLLRG